MYYQQVSGSNFWQGSIDGKFIIVFAETTDNIIDMIIEIIVLSDYTDMMI
jgi:hypothetical protein